MGNRDPRVDAYIAKAPPFAQPILQHVREAVHEACPEVEETLKWSMPSFLHAGAILAGMAAFKQHASFGYWKHAQVLGPDVERDGMGSYGKMTSVKDLPAKKQLLAHIRKAMTLNEPAAKAPRKAKANTAAAKASKPLPEVPADLAAALKKNKAAKASFDAFPPSAQRDYVDWITEAKRDDTRQKRLVQAVEWMAEGKRRNWKYERC